MSSITVNVAARNFGASYSPVVIFRKKNLNPNRFTSYGSYKFSKFYKIIGCKAAPRSMLCLSTSVVTSGRFIQVVSKFPNFGYLKDFQIKASKNLVKKPYKRFFVFRMYPYLGVTKKPAEVRMGKGKGSKVSHYVFPMSSGFTLALGSRRLNPQISDLRFQSKVSSYLSKLPFTFSMYTGSFLVLICL